MVQQVNYAGSCLELSYMTAVTQPAAVAQAGGTETTNRLLSPAYTVFNLV